ncbi:acyl-CoA dehydrogenase family protein [Hahella ganghwensis]|uniref:acyl-CoA dehydrogenase family protein n=1 Tax=Hahella ganghwensis TaxID=286420 RepID=UPI000370654D|nr:acyl-CoA dehydrogenase family protein [Hahella ganghwensis]
MPTLTPQQELLIQKARDFVQTELLPLEAQVEKDGGLSPEISARITRKSREIGLFASNIDERFGGGGLSALDNVLVQEQLGATKEILARRAAGNIYECLIEGTVHQIESFLIPSIRGERFSALAVSEPEAGSDAASIQTRAEKTQTGWILHGKKHFISDAENCDYFIVAAVTAPNLGPRGISLFLVEKDMKGFSLGKRFNMLGFKGTSHCELIFDNIVLGQDALLGQENEGFRMLGDTLGKARLAKVGARAIGKCQRLLHLMRDHARDRQQFGKAIIDYGPINQMIADSAIEIAAARALVLQTARDIDAGMNCREAISQVKVLTTETLGRVADRAVQVFGARGCHDDHVIESFYRDARLYRIIDGTSEIHRNIIVKEHKKPGTLCPVAC